MKSAALFLLALCLCLVGCGDKTTIIQSSSTPEQLSIVSVEPAANEQQAPKDSVIKITLDGTITNASMNMVSCSIFAANQPVAGTLTFFESELFFVPAVPLTYGQIYTVSFLTRDNSIESRSWTFKVENDPDPFTFGAPNFPNGPESVPVSFVLSLPFTLPLDESTFSPNDISLRNSQNQQVPVDCGYDTTTQSLTLAPVNPLDHAETYTLHYSGTWTSTSGKPFTIPEPITFTTETDTTPPAILWTNPTRGATAVPYNSGIVIRFSEPLDPSTVVGSNFTISYPATSATVPFSVEYNPQGLEVTLIPASPFSFTTNVQVDIAPNILDRSGNAMAAPYAFSFITSVDNIAPTVVAITPANNATGMGVDTHITIEFSEPIDPNSVVGNTYLFQRNNGYYGQSLPNTVTVNGKYLTITPTGLLQNDTSYKIDLNADYYHRINDLSGNLFSGSQEFFFATEPLGTAIDIGMAINAFTYDQTSGTLYGVNKANRKLLVVDLATKTLTNSIDLTYRSADLCLHRPSNRIFLANENTTYISEIDLATGTESNTITWAANHWGDGTTPTPFEIKCGADQLYIIDGQWAPALWTIDLASPETPLLQGTVANVGGIALSADESKVFSWYQYGWSAGFAGSYVTRYDKTPAGYDLIEQSTTGYPQHSRDPLDSPIFYDETGSRVVNKQYVFNAGNLAEIINRFDDTEVIYAADFSRERVASKRNILSLTNFRVLRTVPIDAPDGEFFDKDGNFYMIKNAKSKLYYLPTAEIPN